MTNVVRKAFNFSAIEMRSRFEEQEEGNVPTQKLRLAKLFHIFSKEAVREKGRESEEKEREKEKLRKYKQKKLEYIIRKFQQ